MMTKHLTFHRANNVVLTLIILLNSYVVLAPFLPKLEVWWQLRHTGVVTHLGKQIQAKTVPQEAMQQNRLVIPAMGLDTTINEASYGNRYAALHIGPWRYDRGSTPDKGGNTVIAGHRFTYTNPRGVFYALDKVQVGDQLAIYWSGRKYLYQVSETKVVQASDTSIQDATPDARLTLFTCTPLIHPKDRLVVIAERIES